MKELTLSHGVIIFSHLVIASLCIYDLFSVSRRSYKLQWVVFLLLIPFLSALAYRLTMKRRRTFLF